MKGHHNLGTVDKRNDNVYAWLQCGIIFTKSFYYFRFRLRYDYQALFHQYQRANNYCD